MTIRRTRRAAPGAPLITLPWWEKKRGREALSTWIYRSIRYRPYTYRFEPEAVPAPHVNFSKAEIVIDPVYTKQLDKGKVALPQTWAGLNVERTAQLDVLLARAITWHECAHVLYTDPGHTRGHLHATLVNILEDERIERGIARLQPWTYWDLVELGRRMWTPRTKGTGDVVADWLNACLNWRWGHEFGGKKYKMYTPDPDLWTGKIRPLVEQAWDSPTTREVADIASEIIKLLDLKDEDRAPEQYDNVAKGEAAEGGRPDKPQGSFPTEDEDVPPEPYDDPTEYEPDPVDPSNGQLWQQPYADLEGEIMGSTSRVADELKVPDMEGSERYSRDGGRIAAEAIIRSHGDMPFIREDEPGDTPDPLAVLLLLDGTSSMGGGPGGITADGRPEYPMLWEGGRYPAVRRATLMLNNACDQAGIPLAIAYCRNMVPPDHNYPGTGRPKGHGFVVLPSPVVWVRKYDTAPGDETVKGRIAGLWGDAGREEIIRSMQETLPELRARPEGAKLCVYIHDGAPNDMEADVQRYLAQVRDSGVVMIGMFLGAESSAGDLKRYFGKEYVIVVEDLKQLGDRLGRVIRKMRWGY